ncbi:hypothetical protein ACJJTC_011547 [Scirpophaga incertulas]
MVTDGKTAAFLQGREFLAFGSLLNAVPEEDLYYVNFGDPSVLKYFSSNLLTIHRRKYGVLAAAYTRYFGYQWYTNSTQVNELGYLLCGFPARDLKNMSPKTFKELETDLINKVEKCGVKYAQALFDIAIHPEAYGRPYMWSPHDISHLSALFICIPEDDISSLKLEAMPSISENMMKTMHQRKLEFFTMQQILRFNPKARRVYVLRMQLRDSLDMSKIT